MAVLVKVSCAAKEIGLNKYTLYKLAGEGKAPCYRGGEGHQV